MINTSGSNGVVTVCYTWTRLSKEEFRLEYTVKLYFLNVNVRGFIETRESLN